MPFLSSIWNWWFNIFQEPGTMQRELNIVIEHLPHLWTSKCWENIFIFSFSHRRLWKCVQLAWIINPSGWGVPCAPPTISYECNSSKQHQANTALAAFPSTTKILFQIKPRGNGWLNYRASEGWNGYISTPSVCRSVLGWRSLSREASLWHLFPFIVHTSRILLRLILLPGALLQLPSHIWNFGLVNDSLF